MEAGGRGGARRRAARRSVAARANTRGREEPGREGKRQRGPWQLRDATRELGRLAGCCRRGALTRGRAPLLLCLLVRGGG